MFHLHTNLTCSIHSNHFSSRHFLSFVLLLLNSLYSTPLCSIHSNLFTSPSFLRFTSFSPQHPNSYSAPSCFAHLYTSPLTPFSLFCTILYFTLLQLYGKLLQPKAIPVVLFKFPHDIELSMDATSRVSQMHCEVTYCYY